MKRFYFILMLLVVAVELIVGFLFNSFGSFVSLSYICTEKTVLKYGEEIIPYRNTNI